MGKYNVGENEEYLLQQNKLGIKNADELEIAEQYAFTVRSLQFEKGEFRLLNFDLPSLLSLHGHLFQDIYTFAGKIQDVQLMKGSTRFCQAQYITSECQHLFRDLMIEQHWKSIEEAADRLAYFKSELNIIHPFREGNGRTIRLFIHAFASDRGFSWKYNEMNKEQYMNAMIQSVYNQGKLEMLFEETLVKMN